MNTPDLYDLQFEGLCRVHGLVTAELTAVAHAANDVPLASLIRQATGAGQFLLGHHHMEDTILFPGLRTLGTGANDFLDERDREHRVIHALTERLLGQAAAPHPQADELSKIASELLSTLGEHLRREEAGLRPENLRRIITPSRFAEVVAQIDAARAAAQVRIPGT